jgi:hypothetical protein
LYAKQDQQDVITLFERTKSAAQRIPFFLVICQPEAVPNLSGFVIDAG